MKPISKADLLPWKFRDTESNGHYLIRDAEETTLGEAFHDRTARLFAASPEMRAMLVTLIEICSRQNVPQQQTLSSLRKLAAASEVMLNKHNLVRSDMLSFRKK